MRSIKVQIEAKQTELEQAQRATNWEQAARIQYGDLADLRKRLETAEARFEEARSQDQPRLVREEVTVEELATVVAKWTGISRSE